MELSHSMLISHMSIVPATYLHSDVSIAPTERTKCLREYCQTKWFASLDKMFYPMPFIQYLHIHYTGYLWVMLANCQQISVHGNLIFNFGRRCMMNIEHVVMYKKNLCGSYNRCKRAMKKCQCSYIKNRLSAPEEGVQKKSPNPNYA